MTPRSEVWDQQDSDRHVTGMARSLIEAPAKDISGFIREAMERARGWAAADRIALVVSHPDIDDVSFASAGGDGLVDALSDLLQRADGPGPSPFDALIRDGKNVVVPSRDALGDAQLEERAALEASGTRSLVAVPVLGPDGRRLGCLALDATSREREWELGLIGRVRMLAEIWTSIVQRAHIDLALERSQVRFEALSTFSNDIVCEFSESGELVFVSPAVERALGVPAERVLGRAFLDLVHPEDRERAVESLRLRPNLTSDYVTLRLRRSDGSYLWVEADASSFPDLGGPRRILALLRDISHRYERQARLEEQLAMEREVTRLSREFVGLQSASLAEAFRNALESSATIAGCDQSYVVITMPDLNAGEPEMHVWTRPGIEAAPISSQGVAGKAFRWFGHKLVRGEAIVLPTLDALPEEAAAERESLERRGIDSYLGLPLMEGDRTVGVLGFVTMGRTALWSDHQVTMLRLVAELFGAVFRRARSEAQVREREERFRVLADQSPDPIIEVARDGRILFASRGFAALVGDPEEDWVGRNVMEFVAKKEWRRLGELRDTGISGRSMPPAVFRCHHGDGRDRFLEASLRALQTAGGDRHALATLRDVTARLETERTLEQQLLLERQIANISRDFMTRDLAHFDSDLRRNISVVADLTRADHCAIISFETGEGGGAEVFEWFNDEVSESQRTPIDLDPADFPVLTDALRRGETFHVDRASDLPRSAEKERASFERYGVKTFLAVPFMRNGRLEGVFVLSSLIDEVEWNEQDMAILSLAGDILHGALVRRHGARRLEQSQLQLLQSQKMEAVGTLAGGIAHDFNNQLAVMLGNARFVLERAREGDEERDALLDLERAAEHCAQLTRSLLAFSRQTEQAPRTLDVASWLDDVAELVHPLLPSNILLDLDVAPGVAAVHADETQLQQVMVNLLVNARDAMPMGGRIGVRAGVRTLGQNERDLLGVSSAEVVELTVSDTGVGMSAEVSARIFEPFFTTKPLGEGTGLGLATVYGIVQQCGGSVTVESQVGKGTTFRVVLPRHDVAAAVSQRTRDLEPRPSHSFDTVLLVEDEPAVRRVVRRMLEPRAKRVIEARNGDEALELVGDRLDQIDLVVTDMVMPRMGGLALARKMAEQRPDLPTLFLSGYPDDDLDLELDPGRRRLFLQKPFTQRDLEQALEALLASTRPSA